MYFSETQYFLRTIDHPHKLLISHLLPYFNVVIMDLHLFHAISPIKVTRKLTLNINSEAFPWKMVCIFPAPTIFCGPLPEILKTKTYIYSRLVYFFQIKLGSNF